VVCCGNVKIGIDKKGKIVQEDEDGVGSDLIGVDDTLRQETSCVDGPNQKYTFH
jgi:hypothetical protein